MGGWEVKILESVLLEVKLRFSRVCSPPRHHASSSSYRVSITDPKAIVVVEGTMTPARAVLLPQASRPALLASRRARPTGVRKRVDVSCEAMRHLLIPNGDGDGSHLNFTFGGS